MTTLFACLAFLAIAFVAVLLTVLMVATSDFLGQRATTRRLLRMLDNNERHGLSSPETYRQWCARVGDDAALVEVAAATPRFAEGDDAIAFRRLALTDAIASAGSVEELAFMTGHDLFTAGAVFDARR